jgi:hypothetical protein
MWPWEHAAFGYLLYSPLSRLLTQRGPDGKAAVLLAVGAVLPDLVDKTLSWGLGVFPTGYALGHSVFLALPVGLGLLAARRQLDTLAFVVAYWAHLLGDVIDPIRYGSGVAVGRVFWPVVEGSPYNEDLGLRRGVVYFREFVAAIPETDLTSLAALYLALPLLAVVIWLLDGAPGTEWLRTFLLGTWR